MSSETTVLIGKKPVMSYVLACLIPLQQGQPVTVKARGRAIGRAVDVVQVLKNRFVKDLKIGNIEIGTAEVTGQDGRKLNVSTIEIRISQ